MNGYDPFEGETPSRKVVALDGVQWMYEVDSCSFCNKYPATMALYFKNTDCYALVYSATSLASFNRVLERKKMLDAFALDLASYRRLIPHGLETGLPLLVALIETKCDLTEEREVEAYEGVKLARELGCSFVQTSARTGHNIDRVFEVMGKEYRDANRPIRT